MYNEKWDNPAGILQFIVGDFLMCAHVYEKNVLLKRARKYPFETGREEEREFERI